MSSGYSQHTAEYDLCAVKYAISYKFILARHGNWLIILWTLERGKTSNGHENRCGDAIHRFKFQPSRFARPSSITFCNSIRNLRRQIVKWAVSTPGLWGGGRWRSAHSFQWMFLCYWYKASGHRKSYMKSMMSFVWEHLINTLDSYRSQLIEV